MSPELEMCAQCPGCGHCAHSHALATVEYRQGSNHEIIPVIKLICEHCGDVCPSDENPPIRSAILRILFLESYKLYLARGL